MGCFQGSLCVSRTAFGARQGSGSAERQITRACCKTLKGFFETRGVCRKNQRSPTAGCYGHLRTGAHLLIISPTVHRIFSKGMFALQPSAPSSAVGGGESASFEPARAGQGTRPQPGKQRLCSPLSSLHQAPTRLPLNMRAGPRVLPHVLSKPCAKRPPSQTSDGRLNEAVLH